MVSLTPQDIPGINTDIRRREGIGCSLDGLHQTGLVTISLHLLTRLVWCGDSIGVLPDWSGEKVKVNSNQTSLVWGKYFGLIRLNRLKV